MSWGKDGVRGKRTVVWGTLRKRNEETYSFSAKPIKGQQKKTSNKTQALRGGKGGLIRKQMMGAVDTNGASNSEGKGLNEGGE